MFPYHLPFRQPDFRSGGRQSAGLEVAPRCLWYRDGSGIGGVVTASVVECGVVGFRRVKPNHRSVSYPQSSVWDGDDCGRGGTSKSQSPGQLSVASGFGGGRGCGLSSRDWRHEDGNISTSLPELSIGG